MQTFTTYDGADAEGVRAEVYVQKGVGVVKEIKENKKGTADVHLTVEKLKYPIHGWVPVDSEAYVEAVNSEKTGDEVSFRIEFQRKSKVDRETPMSKLRENATTAKNNVIAILAEVGGKTSPESVTNPEEDPENVPTGRKIKATPGDVSKTPALSPNQTLNKIKELVENNYFTTDIISHLAALAISQGADYKAVAETLASNEHKDYSSSPTVRKAFSVESPAWRAHNSDGRANLGHSAIQAVAGVELFVRNRVTIDKDDIKEEAIVYFTKTILNICDKIQTSAYGGGFRPDRAAASHVKIRSIVFDTIEHIHPLPDMAQALTQEKIDEWVKTVGRTAYNRFKTIITISETTETLEQLEIPESLKTRTAPKSEPAVIIEELENHEGSETIVELKTSPPAVENNEKETGETITETEKPSPEATETVIRYPQNLLDENMLVDGKLDPAIASTEETISMFKDFVQEFGLSKEEITKITKLLAKTFGPKFVKAQLIPDDELLEFIDFYVASGADNFKQILQEL